MTLMCGPGPIGGPTRSHQDPAVWADDLAGDKFSFVGRQKTTHPGDFLRPGHALERGLLYHDLLKIAADGLNELKIVASLRFIPTTDAWLAIALPLRQEIVRLSTSPINRWGKANFTRLCCSGLLAVCATQVRIVDNRDERSYRRECIFAYASQVNAYHGSVASVAWHRWDDLHPRGILSAPNGSYLITRPLVLRPECGRCIFPCCFTVV
jgi:hypothetical protein